MRRISRRSVVLITAGVIGLGSLAVAAPALAGAGPGGNGPATGQGAGRGAMVSASARAGVGGPMMGGNGNGTGQGWMGAGQGGSGNGQGGMGNGACRLVITAEQGTLTPEQQATLAAMAQEEKLAQDLYAAFAAQYPAVIFDRIGGAEQQHLAAVRTLLDRYGLTDPTAGQAAGSFSDPAVQQRYDELLAQGSASQQAALEVGVSVEKADIAALDAALDGLTAPDVIQLYQQLRAASERHLSAFENWVG